MDIKVVSFFCETRNFTMVLGVSFLIMCKYIYLITKSRISESRCIFLILILLNYHPERLHEFAHPLQTDENTLSQSF